MQGITERLKNVNYTYIGIAIVIILIISVLYLFLTRKQSNSDGQTNALSNMDKKSESFASEHQSQNKKGQIVLYYAMWCGHSRSFLPEWEKFEAYAKEKLPEISVIKVKCEDGKEEMCTAKGVNGFPTVICYSVAGEKVFNKERSMQKLVEFANENFQ